MGLAVAHGAGQRHVLLPHLVAEAPAARVDHDDELALEDAPGGSHHLVFDGDDLLELDEVVTAAEGAELVLAALDGPAGEGIRIPGHGPAVFDPRGGHPLFLRVEEGPCHVIPVLDAAEGWDSVFQHLEELVALHGDVALALAQGDVPADGAGQERGVHVPGEPVGDEDPHPAIDVVAHRGGDDDLGRSHHAPDGHAVAHVDVRRRQDLPDRGDAASVLELPDGVRFEGEAVR